MHRLKRQLPAGRLLLSLLLSGLFAACAGAPVAPTQPVGATLEVANWTEKDMVISVRGRVEATVNAGMRARLRYLPPGPADVAAAIVDGDRVTEGAFVLVEGERQVWDLATEDTTRPMPAPLGDVVVRNVLDRAMVVSIPGRRLGRVFPGQARRFRDLPVGTYVIHAVGDADEIAFDVPLELTAEATADVALKFDGARLIVTNTTKEPIEWEMNGVSQGIISAGDRWTSPQELPERKVLTAMGLRSKRPYETAVELVAGETTTWALDTSQGALSIENTTGETIEVLVPGVPARTLAVGETSIFEDVPSGFAQVAATGAPSGHRYVLDVELVPGQRYHWRPLPVQHTLRVVNRTQRTLLLYVGKRTRGEVGPRDSVVLTHLPAKAFDASAYDSAGTVRFETIADPTLGLSSTWVIQDLVGAVEVDNRRPEAVRVYLDAKYTGDIEPRSTRTFTGVPVGVRMVEAVGARSGAVLRRSPMIREETLERIRLEDPTGFVTVANETPETLRPIGSLNSQKSNLRAGDTHRFLVRAGTVALLMRGTSTGRVYETQLELAPEADLTWTVKATEGAVRIWNRVDEAVAISLDGEPHGRLAPGETLEVAAVRSGNRRVVAHGTESGRSWQTELAVGDGAPAMWNVTRVSGRIVVDNLGDERLTMTLDGRPLGAAEPHAAIIFPNVLPGERVLVAEGETSGVSHRFDLVLRDAQDERVVIHPPNGTLIIDNQSGEPVEVRVDGELVGTVGENAAPTAIPVSAGPRVVELLQTTARIASTFELTMNAGASVHLPVAPNRVRLVVVNKRDQTLRLYVGDSAIGAVEPGASRLFEDIAPGQSDLRAIGPDKAVTHVEERTLFAGETATWVLQ